MNSFAIIVTGKEARSGNAEKSIMAEEGERFWVILEPEGWVKATSARCRHRGGAVPDDLKTFTTREAAERFAKRWQGHPWWCVPKSFEIIEVKEKTRVVHDGWSVVKP